MPVALLPGDASATMTVSASRQTPDCIERSPFSSNGN